MKQNKEKIIFEDSSLNDDMEDINKIFYNLEEEHYCEIETKEIKETKKVPEIRNIIGLTKREQETINILIFGIIFLIIFDGSLIYSLFH